MHEAGCFSAPSGARGVRTRHVALVRRPVVAAPEAGQVRPGRAGYCVKPAPGRSTPSSQIIWNPEPHERPGCPSGRTGKMKKAWNPCHGSSFKSTPKVLRSATTTPSASAQQPEWLPSTTTLRGDPRGCSPKALELDPDNLPQTHFLHRQTSGAPLRRMSSKMQAIHKAERRLTRGFRQTDGGSFIRSARAGPARDTAYSARRSSVRAASDKPNKAR